MPFTFLCDSEADDTSDVLSHAVDLEVIKQRSQVPSKTTGTHEDFRARLLERDGCCIWTDLEGVGIHIIPYAQGDEACSYYSCAGMRTKFSIFIQWLRLVIIENPPHDENSKMSTSSLSTILGTASLLLILFITTTETHETSLSSKFVRSSFLQSDHH